MNRSIYFILTCFVIFSCGQTSPGKNTNTAIAIADTSDAIFRTLSDDEIKTYSAAIEAYYNEHLAGTGFNGSFLVAKNGQVLYEDYRGFANFATKEPVTEHAAFHLASISKTFTSAAILKLWEEHRISLDDSLQRFFPGLPYHGINIRMLLNHRSGLPNYLYFMDSVWNKKQKATNQDVLSFMMQHHPAADAAPNRVYHYCNTNYMLLALIIEIVTQQPYPVYMKDSVFTPMGLKDTYVFSISDTARYVPTYSVTRPFVMDHLDCTYGDKNIYSSARDLFTWDKVLYKHSFLSQQTLDSAFKPYSFEKHTMHNYGLGWHLYFNNTDTIIYHNGKWHGSNTVFTRLVQDTAVIIVLGNKVNANIYHAKNMQSIFSGHQDENNMGDEDVQQTVKTKPPLVKTKHSKKTRKKR